jgi:Caspase domain
MLTSIANIGRLGFGFSAALALAGVSLAGQEVTFETELPRTLVFIQEEGRGQVAAREMTSFLRDAGFPVIDPALAFEAAQRDLVKEALDGDEGAATELGRDFGAQLLVLGVADWGTRPDPVDGSLITATTEVSIRALRLDRGEVVSSATGEARVIEATEQAARNKAIRQATEKLLTTSTLVGRLMNDWLDRPWEEEGYWKPDPGSIPQAAREVSREGATGGGAPGLAVLRSNVVPAQVGATRGIGVVRKGAPSLSGVTNAVQLDGVVVGQTRSVLVQGKEALLQPLDPEEAGRLGLTGIPAQRFTRRFDLPISQDSVRIVATAPGGEATEAVASPRIDKRWAVVIGIGQYASDDIPDLEYARSDAQAMYDFLSSDAAGPFDEILLLTDEEATGEAMREALFVFLQQADWDDLVVIYYAGHGAPDPHRPDNLYLFPTDSDVHSLPATGFPMWDMKTAVRRHIAAERVAVFVDACHSAGTSGTGVVGGAAKNAIAGGFASLFTPSRRLMMAAAATEEFSFEGPQWEGHGAFTYHLLEGLAGRADTSGDGIVTFTEAFDHVSRNVRLDTDGQQNPQWSGFGDVPLAVVSTTVRRPQ